MAALSFSSSAPVRGTGGSSAASKRSAAAAGYTSDRFAEQLLPREGGQAARRPRRRAPAIHRGYYIRAQAVGHCLRAFLQHTGGLPSRQVVSLGAGMDSLYFWAKDEGLLARTRFFEVDFPEVAAQKASLVAQKEELATLAAGTDMSPQESEAVKFSGEDYTILGADLSELQRLKEAMHEASLDPEAPTLILAEIHPDDPFGHIMQNHFSRLQSPLRSLVHYPNCKAQQLRFLQRGWTECCAIDMNQFYGSFVPGEEQQRIRALEPFDEFEEWHLKCSHYFILVASKGTSLSPAPVFSNTEAFLTHQEPTFVGMVPTSICATDAGASGLRRYGHRSVLLSPHVVLTVGGFGDQDGRHCRLTQLHLLIKPRRDAAWESRTLCLAQSGEAWDGRLFHTLTLLQAGWAVVMGGRRSPVSPAPAACRLSVLEAGGSPVVELIHLPPIQGLALPRWRHSATEVIHEGETYLFVYGGCSSRQCVLADWCFLYMEEMSCHQVPVDGPVPVGRHSHSACGWAGGVLIAGGLDAAEQPLGSILFLRPAEKGFQWQSLETCPPLTPR
ncbi:tRNA wybutosine-synthesizing protein 4 isoform X2 [Sceloporus undulatus]|uniref:tRNA wybutosine-synthesizing protein 4 isoform X2 n=1 Tax=Sceloporus undulatus TaxID=8520 RepID=UPI001C4B14C8|nr:tRNA wybutosine-synthesizing protein 4 isoform X2 [Sceloporus undulatus]